MIKRNKTQSTRTASKKQASARRWPSFAVMLMCGLMLVSGFFFAGRQHFSSMDFGMKNSRLRKQVDELESEKRRLLLAREVSLSPAEIKKAAKKTGIIDQAATEGMVAQVASTTKEKATPPQVSDVKSMVIKTVAVTAVAQRPADVYAKAVKIEKVAKKVSTAAE
ncbi:hypothetical protein BH10ACI3_BH10ACI3_00130 [soil metagenome]